METRRRQQPMAVDPIFSSANRSSSRKQPRLPPRPSAALPSSAPEFDVARWSRMSSDTLTMMMALRRPRSSVGSCGGWSAVGPLPLGPRPCTPSPVLSPDANPLVSDDPPFATPNESSCVISGNGVKSASSADESVKEAERKLHMLHMLPFSDGQRSDGFGLTKSSRGEGVLGYGLTGSVGRDFYQSGLDPFYHGYIEDDDDDDILDGRLPALTEGHEERGCNSILRSSDEDDGASYAESRSNCSGYENSDIDSIIEERRRFGSSAGKIRPHIESLVEERRRLGSSAGKIRPHIESMVEERRRLGSSADKIRPHIESMAEERRFGASPDKRRPAERRSKVDSRLGAWKEARTIKIINKLRAKEAAIDEWEKKKTAKAKMEMKELEMKMEKKRERAMKKMQARIKRAQKEAGRRKAKEKAAATKEIHKVAKAFEDKEVGGKFPCGLILL